MKIDFDSSTQQTQTELNEKFFSIADPAFIFDLLRNKIYSNPILAVCRELACNALDANREADNGHIPVEINLPNYQEKFFKVKDSGPGISPDRMESIYLKYAASTKRDSNDQIGAFGIGAKSPFSYSDSFTIVTNHNGKCYNYAAFIDESRIGKLITLSETDTIEPNGTEIIVPVNSSDFVNFNAAVERSTRHWNVKPKINGGTISWRNVEPTISGSNWFISGSRESYYNQSINIVVGEIEYSVDVNACRGFADMSVLNSFYSDLYLKFDVGEVSLAANRESVYLDPKTKNLIAERIKSVKSEFVSFLQKKVDSQPTYWDACCFAANDLGSICRQTDILGDKVKWNGINTKTQIYSENADYSIWEFTLGRSRYGSEQKITRRSTSRIYCAKGVKIVMHDCGTAEPTSRHIKMFFYDGNTKNPTKTVYVVVPKDSTKEDFDFDDFVSSNFEHISVEFLSKHNNNIKAKRAVKSKFIISKYNSGNDHFGMCSVTDTLSDTGEKILVYLEKDKWNNSKVALKKDKVERIRVQLLRSVLKHSKVSIYGVDKDTPESKIKEVFPKAKFLEDHVSDIANSYDREYFVETMWLQDQYEALTNVRYYHDLQSLVTHIANEKSTMKKYFSLVNEIRERKSARNGFIDIMSSLGKYNRNEYDKEILKYSEDNINAVELVKSVEKTYPMLKYISSYHITSNIDDFVNYVNAMDKVTGTIE